MYLDLVEVVTIDGKTLRGSQDQRNGQRAIAERIRARGAHDVLAIKQSARVA